MPRSLKSVVAVVVVCLVVAHPSFAACSSPLLAENAAIPLGHDAADFALADVNGDEMLDAITTSTTAGNVKVRLGNGTGTFGEPETYTAPKATELTLGDLNGDTHLDLIVASEPAQTPECVSFGSCAGFSVLLNDGDGTFGSATTIPVPYAGSIVAVDASDVDGDGKLDVLVGAPPLTATDPSIHVFFGNGSGAFPTRNSWTTDGAILDVDAELINQGGAPTIIALVNATANNSNTRIVIYDAGWATPPQPSLTRAVGGSVMQGYLAVTDFNNDTWPDVVAVHAQQGGGSGGGLLLLTGSGWVALQTNFAEGLVTYSDLDLADADEDGDPDLVLAIGATRTQWEVMPVNNGSLVSAIYETIAQGGAPTSVATGDVNGDGRTDLYYLDTANDVLIPLINACNSRYAAATLSSSPNPSIYGGNATFTATVTPKPHAPLPTGNVTFYEGTTVLGAAPLNAAGDSANAILTLSNLAIGSHPIHAVYGGDSDFGTVTTTTLTHTVQRPPFGAPVNVIATGNGAAGAITIRWVSTSDVASHDVLRRENGAWIVIGNTSNEIFTDTNVTNTNAYIYAVRSNSTSGAVSPNSIPDIATTATLALPSDRKIRATDITTTRQLIASLRLAAGATPFTFTDATLTGVVVKAVHLTELRAALNPPRTSLGLPAVAFTNPTPTAKVTTVKLIDIQEIRNSFQ